MTRHTGYGAFLTSSPSRYSHLTPTLAFIHLCSCRESNTGRSRYRLSLVTELYVLTQDFMSPALPAALNLT